jgi:hypothetical protein
MKINKPFFIIQTEIFFKIKMSEEEIKKDLISLVDENNALCLNQKKENNLKNIFINENEKYLESDTDQ